MAGDERRRVPARDGDRDGAVGPVGAAQAWWCRERENIYREREETYN